MVRRNKKSIIKRILFFGPNESENNLLDLGIDELEGILEDVSGGLEGQPDYSKDKYSKLRPSNDKKFQGHTLKEVVFKDNTTEFVRESD